MLMYTLKSFGSVVKLGVIMLNRALAVQLITMCYGMKTNFQLMDCRPLQITFATRKFGGASVSFMFVISFVSVLVIEFN